MRVIAGVVLFGMTALGAATLASTAGVAADGRIVDDTDAPLRTGRFDTDALLAAMAYDPPAVTPSAARATADLPALDEARWEPEVKLSLGRAPADPLDAPAFNVPAAQKADDNGLDAKEILLRIGPREQDRKRGRWFVFAGGSGEAFGLNLIRDRGGKGLRRAGWSLERMAEFGKAQVGVGWRRGSTQVSLAASRREIGAYGVSREDTVLGVTVSVKP